MFSRFGGAFLFMTHRSKPLSPRQRHLDNVSSGLKTVFLSVASSSLPTSSTRVSAATEFIEQIVKSPIDEREYKAITLKNGLRVLLISDPDTIRSAAALDVHVGSFCDPIEIPGLAHFCEHMLFLGNKKFPNEDDYSKYLSSHGGTSNAYTSSEDTCFFFDVNADYLEPTLDRFSQFFISPLFTESATSRELNAVDSEHAKNINNDGNRIYQLEKQDANPQHPNSRFSTGNKDTLETIPLAQGINVRDALLQYHSEFYSANIMTLAILGKDSLQKLEKLATNYFSGIPSSNRAIPALAWWGRVTPYLPQRSATAIDIVPITEARRLQLSWNLWVPTPAQREALDHLKPEMIVTHLLGHESRGSLRSFLVSKGWINSLQASIGNDFSDNQQLDVSMDLTVEGFKHRYDIAKAVFAYLALLRRGIPDYIFDEVARLSKISFDYSEKTDPSSFVSSVAAEMQQYTRPSEYLTGSRVMSTIDPVEVNKYMLRLTPRECRIKTISSEFKGKTKRTEKWYGTEFSEQELTQQTAEWERVTSDEYPFKLPAPNDLIPTDFALLGTTPRDKASRLVALNEAPVRVSTVDSSRWTLWYKLDRAFKQPKIYTVLSLAVPAELYNPSFLVKAKLFNSCFMDSISEFVYDASLAGLYFDIEFTSKGVQFTISGFSDKLPLFTSKVVTLLKQFQPSEQAFARFKDVLSREIDSWKTQQPYQHVSYFTSLVSETLQFPIEDLRKALDKVTPSSLATFLDTCLASSYGTALIMGNLKEETAKQVLDIFSTAYPFTPLETSLRSSRQVIAIPSLPASLSKRGYLLANTEPNENDDNSAVSFYYQLPTRDIKLTSTLEVLSETLEESFYNSLRTQQQLGYIVYSGLRFREGVYTLVFTVQSSKYDSNEITRRILAFIDKALVDIRDMDDEAFEAFKEGIVTRKLEPDQRLTSQAGRFWSEIVLADTAREPNFSRHPQEAAVIDALDIDTFKQFALDVLSPNGAASHLLVSQVTSQKTLKSQPNDLFEEIIDPLAFIRSQNRVM